MVRQKSHPRPCPNPFLRLFQILLSFQKLIKDILYALDSLSFFPKPSSSDPTFAAWKRVNHMVLSWLLNSPHRDLAPTVLYADTAAAVWRKDLHDRFSPSKVPET